MTYASVVPKEVVEAKDNDFRLAQMEVKILLASFFDEAKDWKWAAGITFTDILQQFAPIIKAFIKF